MRMAIKETLRRWSKERLKKAAKLKPVAPPDTSSVLLKLKHRKGAVRDTVIAPYGSTHGGQLGSRVRRQMLEWAREKKRKEQEEAQRQAKK